MSLRCIFTESISNTPVREIFNGKESQQYAKVVQDAKSYGVGPKNYDAYGAGADITGSVLAGYFAYKLSKPVIAAGKGVYNVGKGAYNIGKGSFNLIRKGAGKVADKFKNK